MGKAFGPIKIISGIPVMTGVLINVFGGKLFVLFFRPKSSM